MTESANIPNEGIPHRKADGRWPATGRQIHAEWSIARRVLAGRPRCLQCEFTTAGLLATSCLTRDITNKGPVGEITAGSRYQNPDYCLVTTRINLPSPRDGGVRRRRRTIRYGMRIRPGRIEAGARDYMNPKWQIPANNRRSPRKGRIKYTSSNMRYRPLCNRKNSKARGNRYRYGYRWHVLRLRRRHYVRIIRRG